MTKWVQKKREDERHIIQNKGVFLGQVHSQEPLRYWSLGKRRGKQKQGENVHVVGAGRPGGSGEIRGGGWRRAGREYVYGSDSERDASRGA